MSKHSHFWISASLAITLAIAPLAAMADTSRGQFLVSVKVARECQIAVQGVTRQAATASQSTSTARGAVALSCSKNTAYDVSLGSGANLEGAAEASSVTGVGDGNTQVIPVYSQLPAQYNNANGEQASTLVMTIN
ncbi:MAG TPA: spore coat protein U domain-containing protein, partial [Gammaproteobacteria bacterium]|nr:spore coat protein U domain-containing protein [Gammaproteobacteria bacterium]